MVVVIVLAALAAVSLVAAAHWYLWRRLVRDTTSPGGLARRLGTVAAVVLPLLSVGAVVSGRSGMPFWAQQVLAWPGFLWLAVLLYLLLALLVGEVIRPLLRRLLERRDASAEAEVPAEAVVRTPVGTGPGTGPGTGISDGSPDLPEPSGPAPAPTPAPSRRLFVSRVVGGAAATAALATVGYGTYGVLRGPRVKRVTVPLAKLPRAAHGFRIAVVSDIHLGPILGRAHTQRIVDTINSTQPDLIAVVGDLVDGSVENLGPAAEPSPVSRPGTARSS